MSIAKAKAFFRFIAEQWELFLYDLDSRRKITRYIQGAIITVLVIGSAYYSQKTMLLKKESLSQETQLDIDETIENSVSLISPTLNLRSDRKLKYYVKKMIKNPKIIAISVFSQQGTKLAFGFNAPQNMKNASTKEIDDFLEKYPPTVRIIYSSNSITGYIRIRVNIDLFADEILQKHREETLYEIMLFLITIFILLMLTELLLKSNKWFGAQCTFKTQNNKSVL